jgi:hypothetical protein
MRLPGKENMWCNCSLSITSDVCVRWLGKVCNEITSCFTCNDSAMEDKVHRSLHSDICLDALSNTD